MTAPGIYISVGSNIEPQKNIPLAFDLLFTKVKILAISNFYKTPAIGSPSWPDFLNGVIRIDTLFSPRDLKFTVLKPIEQTLGRTRTMDKFAPRTIDLDLLLYDDLVINEPGLVLPDSDILSRNFLAVCLVELSPSLILPGSHQPLSSQPIASNHENLTLDHDLTAAIKSL
jgi:2-amino-4-hydroxy-6-hydroxymethyldihydropteridine diphosphokinase